MILQFYAIRKSVIVNMKTNKAFQGVIWRRRCDYLILKNSVLHENGAIKPVDGEVLIFIKDIDFIQVVS